MEKMDTIQQLSLLKHQSNVKFSKVQDYIGESKITIQHVAEVIALYNAHTTTCFNNDRRIRRFLKKMQNQN